MQSRYTRTIQANEPQVDDLTGATMDTNPIHKGSAGCVPAFQLEFLIIETLSELMKEVKPEQKPLVLDKVEIKFNNMVPIGQPATLDLEAIEESGLGTRARILLTRPVGEKKGTVMHGVLQYAPAFQALNAAVPDETQYIVTNSRFVLTEENASLVARALGKRGQDYASLALGLASKALIDHGQQYVDPQKYQLTYRAHAISFAAELDALGKDDVLSLLVYTKRDNPLVQKPEGALGTRKRERLLRVETDMVASARGGPVYVSHYELLAIEPQMGPETAPQTVPQTAQVLNQSHAA